MVEQETLTVLPDAPAESSRLKLICAGLGAGLLLLLIILIVLVLKLSSRGTTIDESQNANDDLALKLKQVQEKVAVTADEITTAKGQNTKLQNDVDRLTKELESAKTEIKQRDGRLSIAHAKNESLVDQLANTPRPDEPTEQEKADAAVVMRIRANMAEMVGASWDEKKKRDKRSDYLNWTYLSEKALYHKMVIESAALSRIDLLGAPADYRAIHDQLYSLYRSSLSNNFKKGEYRPIVGHTTTFAQPDNMLKVITETEQQLQEVIDKYRLIAGDKPAEVGAKPEGAADKPEE